MPSPFPEGRWRELSALLDQALEAEPATRESLLSELTARDAELAGELRKLLAEHRGLERQGFLDRPPARPPRGPATLEGLTLGPYTLREEIGLGGMGSVWRAERTDGRFSGQVAVKLLRAHRLESQGEARFQREGTILARLRHPHIAQLLDAGLSPSGQPYLVIEYVRGERIDAHCDRQRLGIEARLRLFLDVLAAVSFAHTQLVVHRDLKPSNVLVTEDGTVKLLDFGIAKLLELEEVGSDATALTHEGGVPLTPAYAAPEQLTGDLVSTATDVYALGVLLYVLLTGRHPAGSAFATPALLVRSILEEEPVRLAAVRADDADAAGRCGLTPRAWRAALRGDLENIVARALKKAPGERYATVVSLADDLRRLLAHQPVSTRPDSLRYRALKFVRRNRAAVTLGALAAAALLAGLLGTATQARRAKLQAARADAEARRAVAERDFALLQLGRSESINDLNAYLLADASPEGRPFTADELLARAEATVRAQVGEAAATRATLLVQIGDHYVNRGNIKNAVTLYEEAYALARSDAEPIAHAGAACALADMARIDGDLPRARRLFKEAFDALPDQPEYAVQRAICLLSASEEALHGEDVAAGVLRAQQAQRLVRSVGVPLVMLDLDVSMQLAEAYRENGRFQEAVAEYHAVFEQLSRQGRARTDRSATVLNNWALALIGMGRLLEAEPLLRRSAALEADAAAGVGVSPHVTCNLARLLRDLGQLPESLRLAQRAHADAVRLGDDTALRRALTVEASTSRLLNRPAQATRLLDVLEPLLRKKEDPSQVTFGLVEMERASLALGRGDAAGAAARADHAVEMVEHSSQSVEYLPRTLVRRANLLIAVGRAAPAEQDARRAVALALEPAGVGASSGWIGQADLALARALRAQDRVPEARAAAAEALRHLEPCLGPRHPDTLAARKLAAPPA